MSRLYNDKHEIELIENVRISTRSGYAVAEIDSVSKQLKRKGKKGMATPMVAKGFVLGVIKKGDVMFKIPLRDLMIEKKSNLFRNFVENTLCEAMDDFGVVSSGEEKMFEYLIGIHFKENNNEELKTRTYDLYLKILRDNDVIRKINNKSFVVNPYQLYKNITISGDKLWQLQANWEIGKVMTRWFELEDKERLDILEKKALLDAEWAKEKKAEIVKENEEIKKIYEDEDNIYIDMVLQFVSFAKKHPEDYEFYENQSFEEFMSVDKNTKRFRAWYLRWTKDERSKDAEIKFDYRYRGSYRDAFVELARKHNKGK